MLNNLIQSLIKALGIQAVLPFLDQMLLSEASSVGVSGIERAITLPQSTVETICAKTGASVTLAQQLQAEASQAEARFLTYLASGVDPLPPVGELTAQPE